MTCSLRSLLWRVHHHHVTKDLCNALGKMKCGKAVGPSGIIAKMLKAAGDLGIDLLTELTEAVFCNGVIPRDWQESFILNLYKGKDDALERKNYQGLKLMDQVMKLLERQTWGELIVNANALIMHSFFPVIQGNDYFTSFCITLMLIQCITLVKIHCITCITLNYCLTEISLLKTN